MRKTGYETQSRLYDFIGWNPDSSPIIPKEAARWAARIESEMTDQGSQFTRPRFTDVLKDAGVRISMDGLDNVFIERLWRSMEYECVYLHAFETGSELRVRTGPVDRLLQCPQAPLGPGWTDAGRGALAA